MVREGTEFWPDILSTDTRQKVRNKRENRRQDRKQLILAEKNTRLFSDEASPLASQYSVEIS